MRNVRILIAVTAVFLLVVPAALAQVKPPQPAPVPNVAGRSLSDAQKALVSAGFNAVVTHENVTDPAKNGIVMKQQIPPGTALAKGSSVPVVVGRYTAPAQQPVPNVVGMPLDRAQATLSQAKLNAAVTMQPVDQPQRNNVVLAQNVPAGKPLSPGSTVPIVVGRYAAPAQVKVPYVTGKPLAEAQKILVDNKLNAQVTHQPVAEPHRNGVVIGQKVAVGTPLAPGSMVPVVVGQYTPPARVNVPNVTGKPLAEAQNILVDNKLNAQITHQPVANPNQNGVVLGQKVMAGTPLAPGSMVPVIVGQYTPPATTPVPSLAGMKADAARQNLEKQGWKVNMQEKPVTEAQQAGVVVQQSPPAGTQVQQKNQPVTLYVGKALAQTRVPTVTGMPLDAAQKQLAAAKLNAVVSFEAVAEPAKNNFVLRQQAAPGTALAPGSQVPLVVGKYTAPAALSVPNVTGKPLAEAQKMLAANKLNAAVNQEKVTDRSKDSIVLKQQVAPGTALAPGSQVPLIVGRYEAPAKVPNVVGMNWGEAKTSLTQAKLTPNFVSRSTTLKQKNNIVLEQSVRAGTEVSPGTKVDVFVGRYRTAAEMAREIQNRPQANVNQPIPADNVK